MTSPVTNQHLTAAPGGAQQNPHWVQMLEINARAQADAEVLNRRYVQSPKQTQGLNYDDRLHVRLGCGKTKAYELLNAYTNGQQGGLRHQRIGNKYIVTEQAVREWFGDFGMQASSSKAA
ncbi:MerR family transcriptional regulator [Hymenobacter metallicola]|uniref:DNA-binding protein n=1 Tax=Hymenobacter metallicola TaxID=2563114 RepID=A0A4Z0PZD4_9BACT|nr:helix-turn-helix domain-containing protein [Hymenobacter metallicola]TGE22795.1 DNA-binding protein [Hymenobacter metallicola]